MSYGGKKGVGGYCRQNKVELAQGGFGVRTGQTVQGWHFSREYNVNARPGRCLLIRLWILRYRDPVGGRSGRGDIQIERRSCQGSIHIRPGLT